MGIWQDLFKFLKSLNHIDIFLYIAVLVLLILVVSLIYIIKTSDEETQPEEPKNNDELDIQEVIDNIGVKTDAIQNNCSQYEEEQEEKAIISYDELLKRKNDNPLSYEEEKIFEDNLSVKKIHVDKSLEEVEKPSAYQKEEEFLKNLKAFNESLK